MDGNSIVVSYNAKGLKCYGMAPYDDMQVLIIADGQSKYYSYMEEFFNHYCDSLRKINPDIDLATLQAEDKLPSCGQRYSVYKNFPSKGMLTYTDKIGIGFYLYEEQLPDIEWQLEEGDTTIIGYSCQKAITTFRGRTWKAWYAVELPFDDGPWKLHGLPGLILKAEDADGLFVFETCAIENDKTGKAFSLAKENYELCTRKEFHAVLTEYWQDQTSFLFKQLGMEPPTEKPEEQRCFIPCFLDPQ